MSVRKIPKIFILILVLVPHINGIGDLVPGSVFQEKNKF
jgi:hypothetical protein